VSENRFHHSAAEEAVRSAIAAADRRRRGRHADRRVWRAAPILAAIGFSLAAIARWIRWSPFLPWTVLALGGVALAGYALASRRRHAITDAAAAAIDSDAGLGGELRSASWFAGRETRDEWAAFHLDRAAERLNAIDWSELYPSFRAARSRFATAALVIGALALTFTIPERVGVHPTASAATTTPPRVPDEQPDPGRVLVLSPELQQQLEAFLAAAEARNQQAADALAGNAELRELLTKLIDFHDRELLEALSRALAGDPDGKNPKPQDMKALAERARRAAELPTMPKEMRDALDKLADQAESVMADESLDEQDAGEPVSASGPKRGDTGKTSAASGMQELSIQFTKNADPEGGAGILMMSSQESQQGNGPPGAGVGGAGSQDAAAAAMADIQGALRQELIEASEDTPGKNVETEIRRKTEQGNARVGFTQGTSGRFDKTRAAAPPPVPEARRTGVQTYFIRK
jgi:hypothetical protein